MFNVDKSIKKILKNKSHSRVLATPSFPVGGNMPSPNFFKKFKLPNFNRKNDWDFDGIKNKKDCQPFNPLRQDKYMSRRRPQHQQKTFFESNYPKVNRKLRKGEMEDEELMRMLAMKKRKREREEREIYEQEQLDEINKRFPIDKPHDDRDGDGIINIEDCDPDDPDKQDTYLYLSKIKNNKNVPVMNAYTYPSKNRTKRVFITEDSSDDVDKLSRSLAHEELHHAIAGVKDWNVSRQLDTFEPQMESQYAFRRAQVLEDLSMKVYGENISKTQNDKHKMNRLNQIARQIYPWWDRDISFY